MRGASASGGPRSRPVRAGGGGADGAAPEAREARPGPGGGASGGGAALPAGALAPAAAAPPAGRAWVFGAPVDFLSAEAALARAVALVESPPAGRAAVVLTPNPEALMEARGRPDLRATLACADLALPDGVGVVWAARRAGLSVPGRVPGVEFMQALLREAAGRGWPVFLLGAAPGVAEAAAERARVRLPGLRVAGTFHGYYAPEEEPRVVEAVRRSGAWLLFVGMGGARQQRFLHARAFGGELGPVRLAMGVGGSLDVLAGRARRAPALLRRWGLEWLWRLAREPRRWRRQLALPRFALAVLRAGRTAVRLEAPGPRAPGRGSPRAG